MLISAQELHETINDPELKIVDCRFSLADPSLGRKSFKSAHIPGSIYADLETDLSGSVVAGITGRHPLPAPEHIENKLQQWGFHEKNKVVAYDDCSGAFASRFWWMMRWLGHRDVAILDGGVNAWNKLGLPLSNSVRHSKPGNYRVCPEPGMLIDAHHLLQAVEQSSRKLIDARSYARYAGREEPIDPVAGHIPGAVCLPFEENLTEDGAFRSASDLRDRFEKFTDEATVCYCGSGVTACQNIFSIALAGLPLPKLYAGSWSEWINNPHHPTATHG